MLAKRLGTSRPAYEEHLRKAENKMIKTVGNYMELRARRSAGRLASAGVAPDSREGK
jgi:hypothetical protein